MWANTKRGPKRSASSSADGGNEKEGEQQEPFCPSYNGVVALSPLIARVEKSESMEEGGNYYGTCGIDYSVPKGPNGCPFIFTVPRVKEREKADEDKLRALGNEISQLGFVDTVIGVDAGGDSVTGGIDHNGDPTTGVDQMCGRALKYNGLPFIHCVPGFGCDGESTLEIIDAALNHETQSGTYMGCCSMISWAKTFSQMTSMLSKSRTPNIMAKACALVEHVEKKDGDLGLMLVDRGLKPRIPVEMLATAYFFMRTL